MDGVLLADSVGSVHPHPEGLEPLLVTPMTSAEASAFLPGSAPLQNFLQIQPGQIHNHENPNDCQASSKNITMHFIV